MKVGGGITDSGPDFIRGGRQLSMGGSVHNLRGYPDLNTATTLVEPSTAPPVRHPNSQPPQQQREAGRLKREPYLGDLRISVISGARLRHEP